MRAHAQHIQSAIFGELGKLRLLAQFPSLGKCGEIRGNCGGMLLSEKVAHLEDFGARGIVSPAERFKQYQADCKVLPRAIQGRFWLEVLERDPQVKRLMRDDCQPELTTTTSRRHKKWKQKRKT